MHHIAPVPHQASKSTLSIVNMTLSGKCIASVVVVLVSNALESAQREITLSDTIYRKYDEHYMHNKL